jgi:phosphoribosylformylglycinamidine synthase
VVAVLGVVDDVTRRTPVGLASEGQRLLLVGTTREELSGSEWANVVHEHLGGRPPRVDLAAERALADLFVESRGLVSAAHDLSDGGLAQALVEACLRRGIGARVAVTGDPFVALFAESAGRVLVAVEPDAEAQFIALCESHGCPVTALGVSEGSGETAALTVEGQFAVPLAELRSAWAATLPAAFA